MGAEECAQACSCGDVACALTCAANDMNPVTEAFLNCYQTKCMSAGVAVAVKDHDCSTSGCPAVCECIEANCEDTDGACHEDPTCEAAEECAQACSCGDVACALTCAANDMNPVTAAFLNCYQTKCMSAGSSVMI